MNELVTQLCNRNIHVDVTYYLRNNIFYHINKVPNEAILFRDVLLQSLINLNEHPQTRELNPICS